jgi:hypothetical protein
MKEVGAVESVVELFVPPLQAHRLRKRRSIHLRGQLVRMMNTKLLSSEKYATKSY